ncbi:MAG: Mov34/MPN/PAD-1 family protein [Vicinamibacterales bacterium]
MAVVRLNEGVRAAMVAHARETAPNECCGLLIGEGLTVHEAVPSRNLDPAPTTRYRIDPAVHIAANRRLRGTERSVVGFYHSHPRSSPVPSAADREEAYYPGFIWMIVSLQASHGEMAAYQLNGGDFTSLAIVSEGGSHEPRGTSHAPRTTR